MTSPKTKRNPVNFTSRAGTGIMGILNVTPDSFSDGGLFFDRESAVRHALGMVRDGADIIDVGGESTRPGAAGVSVDEELGRVIPVIEELAGRSDVPISIDTRKAPVADRALAAGASIINDVSGLHHDAGMASVAARYGAPLIIMHMKGTPKDMQNSPSYDDLIGELIEYFRKVISLAESAGVNKNNVIIDPGIGFGKTVEHNLEILRRLKEFKALGRPICVGTSRKSFLGKILGIERASERLIGTIATGIIAMANGADILRVHDVRQMREASDMAARILKG